MALSGTIASLNAALDGLVYSPSASFTGHDQLTITTSDLGHTGGGALTDIDIVALAQSIIAGTENGERSTERTAPISLSLLAAMISLMRLTETTSSMVALGDDTINGGNGSDTLNGGAGNDIIRTGAGSKS